MSDSLPPAGGVAVAPGVSVSAPRPGRWGDRQTNPT